MKINMKKDLWNKAVVLGIALVFVFSAFIPVVGSNVGSTVSRSSEKSENEEIFNICLLYTSPSPRDQRGSRMPSSA